MLLSSKRARLISLAILGFLCLSWGWTSVMRDQSAAAESPSSKSYPPPTTRPLVYIASPYSKGDPAMNTHFQCLVFDRLMNDGVVWPVAPLWSHFQHTMYPRPYKDWVSYDLALIARYDACVRLNAEIPSLNYVQKESSGADGEVAEFKRLGKPVFYSIDDLYAWAKSSK